MCTYLYLRIYDYNHKSRLHDISHVSLPPLISALVYSHAWAKYVMNANESNKRLARQPAPCSSKFGDERMILLPSKKPAPSFTRCACTSRCRSVDYLIGRLRQALEEAEIYGRVGSKDGSDYFFLVPAAASAALFSSAVKETRLVNQTSSLGWTFA